MTQQIATLAGGCFWCLDGVYSRLRGVLRVVSGYMGGHTDNPSYKQICNGGTGHAEVVQVHYDPSLISYADLLEVFFVIHDPTTLNRQGNDVGTQYRSAIFYHDAEQEQQARAAIAALARDGDLAGPIVTELVPVTTLWPAEAYHQGYFDANPYQPYCMAVVAPKVRKAMEKFKPLTK
ncbi:peptide-methionine (S)-S-oxide reductase MsrA [Chitinimonas viridis]|uniref:Peptide methionine sulfoxide reductase MsrA n=1 Tax=Chitinimonas viridis TaxID=664880 RepID=A0ABT8B9Q7_9NEIS|nr:peptide-methionine (S)-S-oxide reductase MsrA [Chitinimonas viridis]MDN3578886.1 peptide-methionine (S)-S-oxide reductase MsrA [Chitinimonas viridis]